MRGYILPYSRYEERAPVMNPSCTSSIVLESCLIYSSRAILYQHTDFAQCVGPQLKSRIAPETALNRIWLESTVLTSRTTSSIGPSLTGTNLGAGNSVVFKYHFGMGTQGWCTAICTAMRVSLTVARRSLLEFGSALVRACNMFVTLILLEASS